MGGKSSYETPTAPNYGAAAQDQAHSNLVSALQTAAISNPNVNTPYGGQTVTWGGDINGANQPTVNQWLSPAEQEKLDYSNRISSNLLNTAETGIDRVRRGFENPFDMSSVQPYTVSPDIAGREAVTQGLIDREEPRFQRADDQRRNDLLIRGFNPGTEAFTESNDEFSRARNDFDLAAIQAGGAEQSRIAGLESGRRAQDIQEQSYLRNLPLNELNSLRSGNQVNNPQFQTYTGAGVAAAPTFAAAQAQGQYNLDAANIAAQNKPDIMGGLFDLGAAGLQAYGMMNMGGAGAAAALI